ncbi:Amino acid permease 3 Amino acid transporter [Vigna angularis]|uniref:Amino acid permease 3 Amino acid transporter n=1 Tax=Phaseolus angularis TaxID=3914 RepID=A0A8T0JYF2_PHAAN|nr:Amino acid permease 3 Amino acid transporter [Vigna angularis]
MMEQGVSRSYRETFEASNGRIQLADSHSFDDDGRPKRTGTMWTASAHIITAAIGSGVLSLAWAIAQLGWIAGPSSLTLFSVLTYYTSALLAACYRTGDQITGNRNYTYMDAVRSHLGRMNAKFCGWVQYANLFGMAIGYTIAASVSMMAVKRSNCYHNSGGKDSCKRNSSVYMISFGIAEIVLSQMPDFDQFWWLSIVAAVMSFTYSAIGLGLGIAKVIGVVMKQDTIKSPPEESKTMSKATLVSVLVTSIFYLLCGGFGYAAFGDSSPGNLLTGFGFYNPYWLLDIANVAIVVHLVGAYQVECQPLFQFIEKLAAQKFPDSDFIRKEFEVPIPGCKPFKLNLFRLVWRTIFVICCTVMAMLLPFFNDIVGLIGAIAYWPLTVYFPVEMYIVQTKIPKWSTKWICLEMLSAACFVLAMVAAVGSIAGVLDGLKVYKPFMTDY